jgi:hypothetical protein
VLHALRSHEDKDAELVSRSIGAGLMNPGAALMIMVPRFHNYSAPVSLSGRRLVITVPRSAAVAVEARTSAREITRPRRGAGCSPNGNGGGGRAASRLGRFGLLVQEIPSRYRFLSAM